MAENSPAYLWYPKDALSSGRISALSALEELWYRRALDQSWLHDGMPADPADFAGWVGRDCTVSAAIKIIEKFFEPHRKDASKVVNPRQEKERKNLRKKIQQKSEAGKRGMASRWKHKASSYNTVITKHNIPIPIPNPNKEEEKKPETLPMEEVHTGTILAGVAREFGIQKLTLTSQKEWEGHAHIAFINGFTPEEFVSCFSELRKKHSYPILPQYVTDRLPDFRRNRKPVEKLPTAEEKYAAAVANNAVMTPAPRPVNVEIMQ